MISDVEVAQYDVRHAYEALQVARYMHRTEEERLQKALDAARENLQRATIHVECPLSGHVDGKLHFWVDCDDPDFVCVGCVYCGEVRDSPTGRVIMGGRRTVYD